MAKQSQYFSSFELPIPRSETQRRRGDTANWEETDEDSNSGCYWVGPPISSTICIDSAPGDLCEIQVNLTQDGGQRLNQFFLFVFISKIFLQLFSCFLL